MPPKSGTSTAPPFPRPRARIATKRLVGKGPEPTLPIRLTVTRGALGLELYQPIALGPLEIANLALTLPGLRFPLDLSGGVTKFRNRRGDLERVVVQTRLEQLAKWMRPRLGSVVGELDRPLWMRARESSLSIGMGCRESTLAFELFFSPYDRDVRWVVGAARGIGLAGPALGYALRALDSVCGAFATRRGRVLTVADTGAAIARAILPSFGVRAPAAQRAAWASGLEVDGDLVRATIESSATQPATAEDALRALELAELVAFADDALASGSLDQAREAYLVALEQAPRHPQIAMLIAEIDHCIGGRAEAALSLLSEVMPLSDAGVVGAELLHTAGDTARAREAMERAAKSEPYAPLSASIFARLAELESTGRARLLALDQAVARSPTLAYVRWARFEARLARREVDAAVADAQHLEAAASGARARHEVCRRAARSLLQAGAIKQAAVLFERALRYAPEDAGSTAGLARAFMDLERNERAVALLNRALTLSERSGQPDPDALMDLARLLAERLNDLPQAIARIRQVAATATRVVEARGLEGRWRAALGDLAGASLAFARMREAVELVANPSPDAVALLVEAAHFEDEVQGAAAAAERHLAVALRLAPHDEALGAFYRSVAARASPRRPSY